MLMSLKRFSGVSLIGVLAIVGPVEVPGAGSHAVTSMSGSLTCPAGETVRVHVGLNHTQLVRGYWPESRSTANETRLADVSVTMDTGLRSTTWRVTGDSLATGSDYCY